MFEPRAPCPGKPNGFGRAACGIPPSSGIGGELGEGEIPPALQSVPQLDHLRLQQHVERTGPLIEHDEVRLEYQSARDLRCEPKVKAGGG